ncbi:MAG: erythromycin esterase family protein, partial [Rudaea sp.]
LDRVDPEASQRARYRYSCLENFHENPQEYGYAASFDLTAKCENEVVDQLVEMQRHASDYFRRDGMAGEDEAFFAEQNARVVANAEEYYRSMFRGHVESWNLRDRHMAGTLDALVRHLSRHGTPARIVLWEHNSHLGDARATEMGEGGELNVGQLVRERYAGDSRLLGMTTYSGTVTAADDWDMPALRKRVRPGLPQSYEGLFHELPQRNFFINLRDGTLTDRELKRPHLERAIGVIYRPETERLSHYFFADLSDQFDGVLHFDETRALEPLERTPEWEAGEPPETFPTGI